MPLLSTLTVLLLALPGQDSPTFAPVLTGDTPNPEVHGVWVSRGYGWLASIDGNGARVFDHGPAGTLEDPEADAYLLASHYRLVGETLQLTSLPGHSTVYTWDRLPGLPDSTSTPPSSSPLSVFDYFWGVMEEHYAFFELRGVDWSERREAHRSRVNANTSEEELWQVLCDMLAGFRDDHMSLVGVVDGQDRTFEDGYCRELYPALAAAYAAQTSVRDDGLFAQAWFQEYTRDVQEVLLEGDYQTAARGQLTWGRIGPIAYLNLRGMGGFADSEDPREEAAGVHALMDRVLEELADCEGLVLDITLNTGGYDEVQLAVASHFADQRRIAFTKRPLDTDDVEAQVFHVTPAEGHRFLGPVSLVTSDFTVSAGEDFALAMREFPHVTHRGSQTRGAFSDILPKTLPNGWILNLSSEAYYDVHGQNWEARGVPPRDPISIFEEGALEHSHVDAIFQIVDKMVADLGD